MGKDTEMTLTVDQWILLLKELNIMFALGIPFGTKYKVKRLIDEITPISDTAEKMRIELLDKYAVLKTEEARYDFEDDENRSKFESEYLGLLNNDETISVKKFSLDEFSTVNNSSDFRIIFKLIED